MADALTDEALKALKNNPDLFAAICKSMDISTDTLTTLIRKKSKSLTTYSTVVMVAKAMKKKPEEILKKV